jgi:hypothetical protein
LAEKIDRRHFQRNDGRQLRSPLRRIRRVVMSDFTSSLKSRVSALAENARDLTLDFEAASGSRFFDNDDQTMKEVQTLLNSRLDREKLDALRRLVAVYSSYGVADSS